MSVKNSSIWREILRVLHPNRVKLFTIHLVYVALGLVLFAPLVGIAGQFLLRLSGEAVLSDMDIAMFGLSPAGMLAIIVFAGLLTTILIFEKASMMAVSAAQLHGQNMSLLDALYFTLKHAKNIYLFSIRIIIRILIIVLPFLAISALIAWFLVTEHDINYYLSEKPPIFVMTGVIIGLVMLTMLFVLVRKLLSWSLALPMILFSAVSPADSFAKSDILTGGHKRQILKSFGLWALAATLLGMIVLGSIHFLANQLVPLFYDSFKMLIIVMGALVALLTLANVLVTTFTSSSFSALVVMLSKRYGCEIDTSSLGREKKTDGFNLTRGRMILLLLVAVVVSVLIGAWLLKGIQTVDRVEIIAHRGAAGKAPENTIAAIRQAIKDKADWVEIDVQETKDGEVVVIHDSDFMKISGIQTKVWDGRLEALRQIDIGSWFDPAFSAERIPTLKEVLLEAKDRAKVLIELKYYGHDEALEQRVVDIVESVDMADSVALMSLKPGGIKKVHALRPDWETGILLSKAIGDISKMEVDFLAINMAMMKPSFVKRAHKVGKKVYIWTANDPVSMTSMISLGVDGIITDEPKMAEDVLAYRAELSTIERLLLHTAVLLGQPVPKHVYRDNSP